MIALAVFAAGLAGWLCWPAPRSRPDDIPTHSRPLPRPGLGTLLGAAVLLIVALTGWSAGRQVAAVTAAGAIASSTAALVVVRHHRAVRSRERRQQVARAAASLAVQLQAGLVASVALRNAAADWSVLQPAVAAYALGLDPADTWWEQSRRPGQRGLADLARGWRLATETGAPLATTLERIAETLESEDAVGRSVNTELAAARATGRLMAALPAVGIGLGYALGGDPLEFLTDSAVGQGCLVLGALLAAAGVLWIERIARGTADLG